MSRKALVSPEGRSVATAGLPDLPTIARAVRERKRKAGYSDRCWRYPHLDGSATNVFGAYDGFVGILSDSQQRKRLEDLKEKEADEGETYLKTRSLSHDFRDGLLEFFFNEKSGMCDLTKNYGVF